MKGRIKVGVCDNGRLGRGTIARSASWGDGMRVGIPKDPRPDQPLVAATPDTVGKLAKLGYEVAVEAGAGARADYPDDRYADAGASIAGPEEAWGSDIVLVLDAPDEAQLAQMREGAMLVGRLDPWNNEALRNRCCARGLTALAMDAVPRLSRAQSLDVRSSMMNVAGYRAVIEAAAAFGRTFAGQVTAAGKTQPARVFVIGVGVAGLAAIGTAGALGAQVFATDVRSDVADQVESLGATFVPIPVSQRSADGYAQALDEEQERLTQAVYEEQCALSDIVITTAQVPGRPAPLLVTAQAVAAMKPGSVIVDMGASALGGNCELSQVGKVVRSPNDVTIIGYDDLPGRLPGQASQLYGQNMANLLKLITPHKDGQPVLDLDDEVQRGITMTSDGRDMWPPPPVKVSAAPTRGSASARENGPDAETPDSAGAKGESPSADSTPTVGQGKDAHILRKVLGLALAAVVVVCLVAAAPEEMQGSFFVFALACVVGFYVITSVTHRLHTPLMAVTNAISGIIIVGAILQLCTATQTVVIVLAAIAAAIASINVFGGFLVTHRMLKMFERSSE